MTNKLALSIYKTYKKIGNEFYINDNYIHILNTNASEIYSFTEDEKKIYVTEQRFNDYFVRIKHFRNDSVGMGFKVEDKFSDSGKRNGKQILEFEPKAIFEKLNWFRLWSRTELFQFQFSKRMMNIIKQSFTHYNATHLEFIGEDSKLNLRIFDIKRFVQQDFDEFAYADLQTPFNFNGHFSIRKEIFDKLDVKDYSVSVGENGLICFDDESSEMFVRTQELSAPVIDINSTHQNTVLLLETTSYLT